MAAESLADRLSDLVHRETQVHDAGVDLTVSGVHALSGPAQVDFGGSELTDARTSTVEPETREPSDDYGWWHLGDGTYLLEYNESFTGTDEVLLQPRRALVERGATHPTLRVTDLPRVPVSVPPAGIHVKENARVSTLCPLD